MTALLFSHLSDTQDQDMNLAVLIIKSHQRKELERLLAPVAPVLPGQDHRLQLQQQLPQHRLQHQHRLQPQLLLQLQLQHFLQQFMALQPVLVLVLPQPGGVQLREFLEWQLEEEHFQEHKD